MDGDGIANDTLDELTKSNGVVSTMWNLTNFIYSKDLMHFVNEDYYDQRMFRSTSGG